MAIPEHNKHVKICKQVRMLKHNWKGRAKRNIRIRETLRAKRMYYDRVFPKIFGFKTYTDYIKFIFSHKPYRVYRRYGKYDD